MYVSMYLPRISLLSAIAVPRTNPHDVDIYV